MDKFETMGDTGKLDFFVKIIWHNTFLGQACVVHNIRPTRFFVRISLYRMMKSEQQKFNKIKFNFIIKSSQI